MVTEGMPAPKPPPHAVKVNEITLRPERANQPLDEEMRTRSR
jgi:hypothetical protein